MLHTGKWIIVLVTAFFCSCNSGFYHYSNGNSKETPAVKKTIEEEESLSSLHTFYNVAENETLTLKIQTGGSKLTSQGAPPISTIEQIKEDLYEFTWTPDSLSYPRVFDMILTAGEVQKSVILTQTGFIPASLQTLVLFNTNSTIGFEIATYYADKRGIPGEHICGIQMPVGLYAKDRHLVAARNWILQQCICPLIPTERRPDPCDQSNVNEIAKVTPIKYLVFTKDVPARVLNPEFPNTTIYDGIGPPGLQDPSLDYLLSRMLYSDFDFFGGKDDEIRYGSSFWGDDSDLYFGQAKSTDDSFRNYVRPVISSHDRIVVTGRIEAITKERTFELVDRTLKAENDGIHGNIFATQFECLVLPTADPAMWPNSLLPIFGLNRETCYDYLLYGMPWSDSQCRVGFTMGEIPGENYNQYWQKHLETGFWGLNCNDKSLVLPFPVPSDYRFFKISKANNASMLLSQNYADQLHSAFDGLNTMLNWRKTKAECIPLCQDFASPEEEAECRTRSTDYFKEINTDCVGTAPGFFGHQLRSWPVQYYGFFPPKWTISGAGDGAREKTPPKVMTGGGFMNDQFLDDNFLRLDWDTEIPNPTCTLTDGSVEPCHVYLGMGMVGRTYMDPPQMTDGMTEFIMKFRYRNEASPGGQLPIMLNLGNVVSEWGWLSLDTPHNEWTEYQVAVKPEAGHTVSWAAIQIEAHESNNIRHRVDIDAFEVINSTTGESFPIINGSFDQPMTNECTAAGDYAANVIDRLGGIAWWGSSSHFLTGGFAYADEGAFMNALLSGRLLGEAVYYSQNAASGIFYGDPLHQPWAAKIWIQDYHDTGAYPFDPDQGWPISPSGKPIMIAAFNGKGFLDDVNWEVDICPQIKGCNEADWRRIANGEKAAIHQTVGRLSSSEMAIYGITTSGTLRLKTWTHHIPDQPIFSFAHFYLESINDTSPPEALDMEAQCVEDLKKTVVLNYRDLDGSPATECFVTDETTTSATSCSCLRGVCTSRFEWPKDFFGEVKATFQVKANGKLSNTATATIHVSNFRDMPTITAIPDQVIRPGESTGPIGFKVDEGGGIWEDFKILVLTAFSDNTELVPNNPEHIIINYHEGPDEDASKLNPTIEIIPNSGQTGKANIYVKVSSEPPGLSSATTFAVSVSDE